MNNRYEERLESIDPVMVEQYNNRHKQNMSRLDIERSGFFNQVQDQSNRNNNFMKRNLNDELEFNLYNDSESISSNSKDNYDLESYDLDSYDSDSYDFDNYDKNPDNIDGVKYNDMFDGSINFADVNEDTRIYKEEKSSMNIFGEIFNLLNINLYMDMKNKIKSNYCVSSYILMYFISLLFICSNDKTEYILKDFFKNIQKREIYSLLINLKKYIYSSKSIKFNECTIISDKNPINQEALKLINNFTPLYLVNNKKDLSVINKNFIRISNNSMIPSNFDFQKKDIVNCQTINFKPIFRFKFNKNLIRNINFIGKQRRVETMVTIEDKTFLTCNNNEYSLVEIDLEEPHLGFGILIRKDYVDINKNFNNNILNILISNLKPEKYSKISFPLFNKSFSYSLINQFSRLGFNYLTENSNFMNLSPQVPLKVKNILQRINIDIKPIGKYSYKSASINDRFNNLVFKADHSFLYYVRLRPTNMLLLTGIYD